MRSPKIGEQISNHEYHNGDDWVDLISSTRFKAMYRDPAAFRWPLPRHESSAMDAGTAAHTAILDPERMDDLLLLPEIGFRSNADKDRWKKWLVDLGAEGVESASKKDDILSLARVCADKRGKSIVTPEQLETARAMSASVLECKDAVDALSDGMCEISFRADGRKARPDCLSGALLSDLKTCARFDRFDFQAFNLMYPSSLAWYELVLIGCGVNVGAWAWIVVESAPYRMAADGLARHRVKVVVASESLRMESLSDLEQTLAVYAECKRNDEWPAASIQIEELNSERY